MMTLHSIPTESRSPAFLHITALPLSTDTKEVGLIKLQAYTVHGGLRSTGCTKLVVFSRSSHCANSSFRLAMRAADAAALSCLSS